MASKISGDSGALGDEVIEMSNGLLCFGFASKEFRVIVVNMADYMANSYSPWAVYRSLVACRLVALDKRPGVRPVRIGDTLRRSIAKLVMRVTGHQEKTAFGSLQLCVGLEAVI